MSEKIDLVVVREKLQAGLVESVTEVLGTMAMEGVSYDGIEKVNSMTLNQEVGGLIRLIGAQSEGMVGITGSKALFAELVSRIVGLPSSELDMEDLLDGVSELTNMICGGMKSKAQAGYKVVLSPPVAIIGKEYVARWKTLNETWILSFRVNDSPLLVHTSF